MKVALVHELLTMRGGAERVLRVLARMFPDAPIYTLLYDERKLGEWFPHERVRTSFLQRIAHSSPLTAHRFNHHLYLPLFPRAVEAWDFSEYDLVLSLSSAFVHGIICNGDPVHLCYVQSPARYLWDRTHEILERAASGPFGPFRRRLVASLFHRLRIWDAEAADRPDRLLAASKTVQRRIALYWRQESEVLYPPLDDAWFAPEKGAPSLLPEWPYYLVVSTLAHYKRIDLAIEACQQSRVRLVIVGEGPDRRRLERLAGPEVLFLGFQSLPALQHLYAHAEATIFPGEEDFGLVPLESLACGTPVIAYRGGGALETLRAGETGEFFDEPHGAPLAQLLRTFRRERYDADICKAHAQNFSCTSFEQRLRELLHELLMARLLATHVVP